MNFTQRKTYQQPQAEIICLGQGLDLLAKVSIGSVAEILIEDIEDEGEL